MRRTRYDPRGILTLSSAAAFPLPCGFRGGLGACCGALLLGLLCVVSPRPAQSQQIACPVDVVFAMDTSGSMGDEGAALCSTISQVESDLLDKGIQASTTLWGITQERFGCLTSNVYTQLGGAVPGDDGACDGFLDHSESWGQATAIVADRFPWTPNAVRVVIPISDEGPCNGNTCYDPGSDRDCITNAAAIAVGNDVFVSPITGRGSSSCVITLASDLASATGGTSFDSQDPNLDLAGAIEDIVVEACVAALQCQIDPSLSFNRPNQDHTVTATVRESTGEGFSPVPGRAVEISVESGPNAEEGDAGLSDASGEFSFTYPGDKGKGVDIISARCENAEGNLQPSAHPAKKFWDADCNANDIPDSCDIDCGGFDGECSAFGEGCGQSFDENQDGVPDECGGDPVLHKPLWTRGAWGEAVEPLGGDRVLLAQRGAGFTIYDVADRDNPSEVASYAPPARICPQGFHFDNVFVEPGESTAYVAAGLCGLLIVDIDLNAPGNPSLIGRVDTPGWAKDVFVGPGARGQSIAYVADYWGGLRLIRVSGPGAPRVVRAVGEGDGLEGAAIAVVGDGSVTLTKAFVATTDGLFDVVLSGAAPVITRLADTNPRGLLLDDPALEDIPQDLEIRDGVFYMPIWMGGLIVGELDGTEIQRLSTPQAMYKVSATDSRVLVTEGQCGLHVFDADGSGALTPAQFAEVDNPIKIGGGVDVCPAPSDDPWAWDVDVSGNDAYVCFGKLDPYAGGLQVIEFPGQELALQSVARKSWCGLGAELALLLPLLAWCRRSRHR